MTIVKSLNEITEGLGGDTTGAHTAEKAIDKLKTVVGGGVSMGTAVITQDEEGGITVELNNLTSFDTFLESDKNSFTEPALVFANNFANSVKKTGEHGFEFREFDQCTLEWVTFNEIYLEYDSETDSFSGGNGTITFARVYKNGEWGDWKGVGN